MRTRFRFVLPALILLLAVACDSGSKSSRAPSAANYLWIATHDDQMVRSYVLDQTSGTISPVGTGGGPKATGIQPVAIALAPDRTTLFVANSGDDTVSIYPVNVDGSLASQGTPVAGGSTPEALAVDSTNNLLFVADGASDSITVFSIIPLQPYLTSDTLILKGSFPIQTPAASGGSGPAALAITPLGFSCVDNRVSDSSDPEMPCVVRCQSNRRHGDSL